MQNTVSLQTRMATITTTRELQWGERRACHFYDLGAGKKYGDPGVKGLKKDKKNYKLAILKPDKFIPNTDYH